MFGETMSSEPIISDFMTAIPQTIEAEQTLAQAAARMRTHKIRHLPVLQNGNLVGILSERDILLLEATHGGNLEKILVEKAMVIQPFTCGPKAMIRAVAKEMADNKYGTAVVVDREHPSRVLGVFTTVDALRALNLLGSAS